MMWGVLSHVWKNNLPKLSIPNIWDKIWWFSGGGGGALIVKIFALGVGFGLFSFIPGCTTILAVVLPLPAFVIWESLHPHRIEVCPHHSNRWWLTVSLPSILSHILIPPTVFTY